MLLAVSSVLLLPVRAVSAERYDGRLDEPLDERLLTMAGLLIVPTHQSQNTRTTGAEKGCTTGGRMDQADEGIALQHIT
ncbi:hypothetical protein GCM10027396_13720 [Insolitispirillum peregrinum]